MSNRKASKVMSARLPAELVVKVTAAAEELGVSVSALLEHVIAEWIEGGK